MFSKIYRLLTDLGAPLITLYLRRRLKAGREDPDRFEERLGRASRARPQGRVVWCHAASVGEAASLLLLVEKLHDIYPDLHILLTTGTVSAARMVMPRLPAYAMHQYIPVDHMAYVKSFLSHWTPSLAIWIESELWPNLLTEIKARHIPAVLLNARMSDRSFRRWHRVKKFISSLLSSFDLCLAQTEADHSRYVALGARRVKYVGNLKYASIPLPCDVTELAELQTEVGGRPLWLMASTHRGEEEIALATHRVLKERYPDLLTIIAPRHAVRGNEVARLIEGQQLTLARRSKGDAILSETEIYLADTMGDLGLLYRLSPIAVIGGSFARNNGIAGHNPIEAAHLGSAIIFGPYMQNFAEIAREFILNQAAAQIAHENEMAFAVERMLASTDERDRRAASARLLAGQKRHILDQIVAELEPWLKR